MSEAVIQLSLLNEFVALSCQQDCFAYPRLCNGAYATAPCSCAWKRTSERYKQCKGCYLICLDRLVKAPDGSILDNAIQQFRDGLPLSKLVLSQKLTENFPLFIPTRTSDFPLDGGSLPLRWAATDAKRLWREQETAGASLDPKFTNEASTRAFLRVSAECRLMAVMNGLDKNLESFWAMDDRIGKFQKLVSSGFELGTGATFSVMHLTVEGTQVPQFHNLTMQRRHHRVANEMHQAGLTSIPNLYWFDKREQVAWINWLVQNQAVHVVSRDLTRTRAGASFWNKMDGLIQILDQAGRSFHVFLVGPGPATAANALRLLAEHGHTGTVITSDPILQGVKGKLYGNGFKAVPFKGKARHELALDNIEMFETHLLDAVANYAVADKVIRNLLLTSAK
jgi:hypothetical protein